MLVTVLSILVIFCAVAWLVRWYRFAQVQEELDELSELTIRRDEQLIHDISLLMQEKEWTENELRALADQYELRLEEIILLMQKNKELQDYIDLWIYS